MTTRKVGRPALGKETVIVAARIEKGLKEAVDKFITDLNKQYTFGNANINTVINEALRRLIRAKKAKS